MPDLSTDHSSATLEGAHSHGARRAYVSSRADRPTSFDPADIPVPAGREEEWRFTPMRRFRPLFDPFISVSCFKSHKLLFHGDFYCFVISHILYKCSRASSFDYQPF